MIVNRYVPTIKREIDLNEYPESSEILEIPNLSDLVNSTTLDLSSFHNLTLFSCGGGSFKGVTRFMVDGLNQLETIKIGLHSFTQYINGSPNQENKNRSFHLSNCSNLKSLEIGLWSFSDYYVMELNNLPNLLSIKIGRNGFYHAPDAHFIGI